MQAGTTRFLAEAKFAAGRGAPGPGTRRWHARRALRQSPRRSPAVRTARKRLPPRIRYRRRSGGSTFRDRSVGRAPAFTSLPQRPGRRHAEAERADSVVLSLDRDVLAFSPHGTPVESIRTYIRQPVRSRPSTCTGTPGGPDAVEAASSKSRLSMIMQSSDRNALAGTGASRHPALDPPHVLPTPGFPQMPPFQEERLSSRSLGGISGRFGMRQYLLSAVRPELRRWVDDEYPAGNCGSSVLARPSLSTRTRSGHASFTRPGRAGQ